MASNSETVRWTSRFGRTGQSDAYDVYREHAPVLGHGLHLNQERARWQEPKPEPQLAEAVRRAVRSRLPLRSDPMSYHDYEELADHYTASVEFLRGANEDMRRFVDALIETNNTYSTSGPDNAALRRTFWENYYGDMAKKAMSSLIPPTVILSAELEGIPVETAARQLCDRVDQMMERFGKGVASALAELQSAELIGRIDWRVPTACDCFYWEDTVLHGHAEQDVIPLSPEKDVEVNYKESYKRVRQDVKIVSKQRHVVRHGLHVKVVGKAQRSPIDRFSQVIPAHIQQFLQATPVWLRELAEIVSGKSRTDFVLARDILVEEQEVKKREIEWREPYLCPLVTVSNYALTGWGTTETHVETARQFHGWLYVLAGALVTLAAISMGLARLHSPLWGYVAPLAAMVSLAVFVEACRKRAIAREETAGTGKLLADGLSWFLLSSGLMTLSVAAATASWVLGTAGGLLSVVGASLVRRALRGTTNRT